MYPTEEQFAVCGGPPGAGNCVLMTFGCYFARYLWNTLPNYISTAPSLMVYKQLMKTLFFGTILQYKASYIVVLLSCCFILLFSHLYFLRVDSLVSVFDVVYFWSCSCYYDVVQILSLSTLTLCWYTSVSNIPLQVCCFENGFWNLAKQSVRLEFLWSYILDFDCICDCVYWLRWRE